MSSSFPQHSLPLILASASPRRSDLLTAAGVAFDCHPAHVDESLVAGESPEATVLRLAKLKANAVAKLYPGRTVLGADTMVVRDAHILGKPESLAAARDMLAILSGGAHEVLTGVCLRRHKSDSIDAWVTRTRVVFKTLDAATIDRYISLVPVLDKAGAYAIQEQGELIVDHIEGSLSNVIGLPMEDLLMHLADWGQGKF